MEPYISFTREEAIRYVRKNYEDYKEKSDEECWKYLAEDYEMNVDSNGNIYSTYNPNSKWDWYAVGGRWGGMLRTKNGLCDEAPVGSIIFEPDKEKYEDALKFWDGYVEGNDPEMNSLYTREYYKDFYRDAETYAKSRAGFSTFAVVTPDGKWHEIGHMGWFGVSSETPEESREWHEHYKERFIDTADPEWVLTIVDCHI